MELLETDGSDFANMVGGADTPPVNFGLTVTGPAPGRPSIGVDGSAGGETGVFNSSLVISPDASGEDEPGAIIGLTFGSEGALTLADGGAPLIGPYNAWLIGVAAAATTLFVVANASASVD